MIIDPQKNFFKNYILSNGSMYAFRFVNTNFGSKWAGLWKFDKKLLDYWAYRVNGEWLSMHNCFEFEHKFWCANHKHKVENMIITEELIPSDEGFISLLKIKNTSQMKLKAEILLEVGVNIRFRETNSHDYRYSTRIRRNLVEVKNEIGKVYFGSINGNFLKKEIHGEHNPGEYAEYCGYETRQNIKGSWSECKQSKYVPGEYKVEVILKPGEEIEIPFFFSDRPITRRNEYKRWIRNSERYYERLKEQYKSLDFENLEKILSALTSFITEKGFVAGYPYFNRIWTRDAFWSLPAFLYLGMFSHVKKFLTVIARKIKNGKVPDVLCSKKCFYNSADSMPLWIIALYDYLDFTGDKKFAREMLKKLKEVLQYGKSRLQDSLISDLGYTWMESIERKKAIDLEALWCRAFYCGGRIFSMLKKDEMAAEYLQISSKILEQIEKEYWNGVPKDNLGENFKSPNFIFQLALMYISRDVSKYLSQIMSKEYLTPVGVRTRSALDKEYNPKGYHTVSAWPFLTLTAAMAQCNYEKMDNARKLLEINKKNFDKQCINGINEFFESDILKPRGCTSQMWSVAGMLTILDSYVLGIKPKLTEKIIILDPSKFYFRIFERKIKIGKKKVHLKYSRKGKRIMLEVKNLPVEAKMPNIYSKCILNEREVKEKIIVLKPKKSYSLLLEF